MKNTTSMLTIIFLTTILNAAPIETSKYIIVDQFGYRPQDSKVAVLADPQIGFNYSDEFIPGNIYEVRNWDNDEVVYTGTPAIWNNGGTSSQSGDRGWWFDFTDLQSAGSYYLYDVENSVRSYQFEISETVYYNVLKAAMRMFYYNRCSIPKVEPYAEPYWTDGVSFSRARQDTEARYVNDKSNPETARDMSGGWFDAGDFNKYVTFAESPVHQLLDAYSQNPLAWNDNFDIPESGNGIPDIIDEIIFELEWLKKMQDSTDGGVFIKMGSITYSLGAPPSSDKAYRYYGPKCSSSSIAFTGMLSHAAIVLNEFPSLKSYADDLINRAELAWQWYGSNPMSTSCDTQEIKAGDADRNASEQKMSAVTAAVYLFHATGNADYNSYVISRYKEVELLGWWGPYRTIHGDALLHYTTITENDKEVSDYIKSRLVSQGNSLNDFYKFFNNKDLYRAFMPDGQYHWGSNNTKGNMGVNNYNLIQYNLDENNHSSYLEKALSVIHYMHGVNPFNKVYLSNMYNYGAENSVNEIYHGWFNDNTAWDNALSSPKGPAPGFIPGGPNKDYNGTSSNIKGQPPQKCYKDFNTGSPGNSWAITEPAIYYQSAYIKLLSKFVDASKVVSVEAKNDRTNNSINNFDLFQNYPNPFNPTTTIKYKITETSNIKIEIFNTLGQSIRVLVNEQNSNGIYSVEWNGENNYGIKLPSGIYFYKLTSNQYNTSKNNIIVRKMLMVK